MGVGVGMGVLMVGLRPWEVCMRRVIAGAVHIVGSIVGIANMRVTLGRGVGGSRAAVVVVAAVTATRSKFAALDRQGPAWLIHDGCFDDFIRLHDDLGECT